MSIIPTNQGTIKTPTGHNLVWFLVYTKEFGWVWFFCWKTYSVNIFLNMCSLCNITLNLMINSESRRTEESENI